MTIYYSEIIPKTPQELERFYLDLIAQLTGSGVIAWTLIDKTGSHLSDLSTRPHSELTNILGNGVLHISVAEQSKIASSLNTVTTDSTLTGSGTVASPLGVAEVTYTTMYDDVGSNISYVGEALPGTASSAASWRIRKLDLSSGDVVMTWADSNANFDNVWANRAALTYGP